MVGLSGDKAAPARNVPSSATAASIPLGQDDHDPVATSERPVREARSANPSASRFSSP